MLEDAAPLLIARNHMGLIPYRFHTSVNPLGALYAPACQRITGRMNPLAAADMASSPHTT